MNIITLMSCTTPNEPTLNLNDYPPSAIPTLLTDISQNISDELTLDGQLQNFTINPYTGNIWAWSENIQGTTTLFNIEEKSREILQSLNLQGDSQRDYNKIAFFSDGTVVIAYQSDKALGQTGDQHGVLIIGANGNVIKDVALDGLTNPEGVVVLNDDIYVLFSNRSIDGVPALVQLDHQGQILQNTKLETEARNASDMVIAQNEMGNDLLVVTSTSNSNEHYAQDGSGGVLNSDSSGSILVIDPNTLNIINTIETVPQMGIHATFDPSVQGVIVSGVKTKNTQTPFAFVGLTKNPTYNETQFSGLVDDTIHELGVGGVYPSGVSSSFGFFSTTVVQYQSAKTVATPIILDLENNTYVELDSVGPVLWSTTPQFTNGAYVLAGSGTGINSNGSFTSTLYFYDVKN